MRNLAAAIRLVGGEEIHERRPVTGPVPQPVRTIHHRGIDNVGVRPDGLAQAAFDSAPRHESPQHLADDGVACKPHPGRQFFVGVPGGIDQHQTGQLQVLGVIEREVPGDVAAQRITHDGASPDADGVQEACERPGVSGDAVVAVGPRSRYAETRQIQADHVEGWP